jgi:hypothetical protein
LLVSSFSSEYPTVFTHSLPFQDLSCIVICIFLPIIHY